MSITEQNEESGAELANAYLASGDRAAAIAVLDASGHAAPAAAFLFARAASDVPEREAAAEDALRGLLYPAPLPGTSATTAEAPPGPDALPLAPHAHLLLGDIYQ